MSDGRRNYQADKEKLRMAKNLVKSNNKKIKKALELLDKLSVLTNEDMHLLKEIKEILEDKS
ncbi:hypothetical protein HX804_03050 [Marine Group I thaumarchaeote]|uniref:Uncharacterized protein n=1 Tax=Marine Group I thaumarchaeote TaxID=2511932 RepID=A0A7K4NLT6_9ARCH|nr:hypothetical protein [Marine Group I thaumarchaeote]